MRMGKSLGYMGWLVWLFGALMLGACTDVISKPALVGYKLAIPTFENRTGQPNLENQLTQEFNQDFISDGQLELADAKDANLILQGAVTAYKLDPLLLDTHNTPQQYRLTITLSLILKDVKNKKDLWTDDKFSDSTTYYVANTLGVPPETEQIAVTRLAQQLSRRLIQRVVDGL